MGTGVTPALSWATARHRFGAEPRTADPCPAQVRLPRALPHQSEPVGPRKAFTQSRAKDNPVDALLLTELVARHSERLKSWQPDEPTTRQLEQLVPMRRRLVDDHKRLTSTLKSYYPHLLEWFDELANSLALDFLLTWPTLADAQRADEASLAQFFQTHNSRRRRVIAHRLQAIRKAQSLTEDPALLQLHTLLAICLAEQLKQLLTQIRRFDVAIEELTEQHQDYGWISSLPGAGPCFAPG